jgi:hypothetical protein
MSDSTNPTESIRNLEVVTVADDRRKVPRRIIAAGVACTSGGLVLVTPLSILLYLLLVAQNVLPYNAELKIYPWAVALGTLLCLLGVALALVIRRFDGSSDWILPLLVFNLLGLTWSVLMLHALYSFDGGSV